MSQKEIESEIWELISSLYNNEHRTTFVLKKPLNGFDIRGLPKTHTADFLKHPQVSVNCLLNIRKYYINLVKSRSVDIDMEINIRYN